MWHLLVWYLVCLRDERRKSIGKTVTVYQPFTDLVGQPNHSCGCERTSEQYRPHSEHAGAQNEDYCGSGISHANRFRTEFYTEGHLRNPSSTNSE